MLDLGVAEIRGCSDLSQSPSMSQNLDELGVPANCVLQTTALLHRSCAALDQHSFADASHALHKEKTKQNKLLCHPAASGLTAVVQCSIHRGRTRGLFGVYANAGPGISEVMLKSLSEVNLTMLLLILAT